MSRPKTAICTHCGEPISYDPVTHRWTHDDGRKTCVKIVFATPRRSSIKTQV